MVADANWKQKHANDCDAALMHPLVTEVINELMLNLHCNFGISQNDSLVRYGIMKVAMYAAQSARAMALGFDPDLLRLSSAEADAELMKVAEMAVLAGKPVALVEPPHGDD